MPMGVDKSQLCLNIRILLREFLFASFNTRNIMPVNTSHPSLTKAPKSQHNLGMPALEMQFTMKQVSNVLIATDFSPCARAALEQAARIANLNDAQLHALHVVDGTAAFELAELLETRPTEIRAQLIHSARHEIEEHLRQQNASATVEVRIGTQIESVVTYARQIAADLLVVGEHSEHKVDAGAGILATRCLRKGPDRVLLVDLSSRGPFQRIIACVDFSENSKTVLTQAATLAQAENAEVCALHVFTPPWRKHYQFETLPKISEKRKGIYREQLAQKLADFAADHLPATFTSQVIEHANPGQGINEHADQWNADLIIVGKRGHCTWPQMLLGSTAEAVVKQPNCSVLAVTSPKAQPVHSN